MEKDESDDGVRLTVCGPEKLSYDDGVQAQLRLRQLCEDSGGRENFLMLVEHPPVVTLGRSAAQHEVLAPEEMLREKGVQVAGTTRGGKVTFHGPGQLVGYPIIDLRRRGRDLHRYLRDLEAWLINLSGSYSVEAHRNKGKTGVWVGDCKLAAIGVAVRRWYSYHGIALNVTTDLSYFDLIVPCGFRDCGVTSLERERGEAPDWDEVAERAVRTFCDEFEFSRVERRDSVKNVE